MRRRDFLATGVVASAVGVTGCTARVTGWSSLGLILQSRSDRSVQLEITVSVDDTQAFNRQTTLDTRELELEASVEIPWGATLSFRAELVGTDQSATADWEASVPLGGDHCRIEPAIIAGSDWVSIERYCKT